MQQQQPRRHHQQQLPLWQLENSSQVLNLSQLFFIASLLLSWAKAKETQLHRQDFAARTYISQAAQVKVGKQ